MPIKHQSDCYRTIDGVKWPNLCDMISDECDQDVADRKDRGERIKMRKHPEGYYQAFIHPDDLNAD